MVELFSTRIDGAGRVRKIIGLMVTGGDVYTVQFVPASQRLVYSADQETDTGTELFTSFYGGGLPGQTWIGPRAQRSTSLTWP